MPIKLLNSDAKGFLTKYVYELAKLECKLPPAISMSEEARQMAKTIQPMISLIESLLANEVFWNESDKFPGLIMSANASSNGDWNGERLSAGSAVIKIRGKLVVFKNAIFDVTGLYTKEEAKLLVLKAYERERGEIDFLTSRSNDASSNADAKREPIPERIRNEVWRRDGAKCVECGSVYKLEFDHVIPIAKGGSNTARNLRILCEPCNRRKSDRIG